MGAICIERGTGTAEIAKDVSWLRHHLSNATTAHEVVAAQERYWTQDTGVQFLAVPQPPLCDLGHVTYSLSAPVSQGG